MSRASRLGLWLRWSWRDLRARWLLVAAIAAIVAVGVGVYTGLSSTAAWRRLSYDESYKALHIHDLQVTLSRGSYVESDRLVTAIRGADSDVAGIAGVETRLVEPTQVDASTGDETILIPGRLVGVDVADGGPHIDGISAERGRALNAADAGARRAVLDLHFAKHYHLPASGRVRVSGNVPLRYVGQGLSPEYFVISNDQGPMLAEAGYAVLFAPLSTVQALAERPGQVNDAVITLAPGVDRRRAARRVEAALSDALPDVAVQVTTREDQPIRKLLYDDIDGDQRLYNIFAFLILGGAAFAAFNLIGRVVEAQRREIGIGMALGVQRVKLAVRPVLVGTQVALLGTALGVAIGILTGNLVGGLMLRFVPLPVWRMPFQPATFLRGAALGLGLPLVSTLWPVWRAVRVDPVDAIKTGPAAARKLGLAPLLRRLARGGNSLRQIPFRNVLRAPRRTLLTTLAVGAAIATLLAVIGMADSFVATIDRGGEEILGATPERVTVDLDNFYPAGAAPLKAIENSDVVAAAEPGLRIGGTLEPGPHEFDVLLSLVDFDSHLWAPTAIEGSLEHDAPGLVIARKAADDLGVGVGDRVTLRHPRREGLGYRWVESDLPVLAIHPNPYRFVAFMDLRDASIMNLDGIVNTMAVIPAPGVDADRLTRALFGKPAVGSVQPVAAIVQTIRDAIGQSLGILAVVRGGVLLLALLIAFNSSSINADERAREHATMFAFGLSSRSVLTMSVVESFVIGVLGTVTGVVLGLGLLGWIVHFLLPTSMPDLGVTVFVSRSTLVTALVLGTVAVAAAPMLTLRRLRRMDIAATLRVVE